jgi:4-hydroxymandelate oxidase
MERIELAHISARAEASMDPAVWSYLMRGAGASLTARDNLESWDRIRLCPHVFRSQTRVSTETSVLGTTIASPVLVAPTGRATRFHPDGEAAVLEAVTAQRTVAVLASSVSHALPELASQFVGASFWSQIYFSGDRGSTMEAVERAERSGCAAIVLTLDLIGTGGSGVVLPTLPVPDWEARAGPMRKSAPAPAGFDDLAWLCREASVPVTVKGVLRADDARRCVDAGARAVVVSNHGGNQLDGVIATADALESVVGAVGAEIEVYVDGGIRSGLSVLKALALGARAVLVGRPIAWGLAANGSAGLGAVLQNLEAELAEAMLYCGVASAREISADLVRV